VNEALVEINSVLHIVGGRRWKASRHEALQQWQAWVRSGKCGRADNAVHKGSICS